VEELFMAEMFPRPTDYLQPQKSSAWLEKAKQLAIQGEKKVEPFNFLPESCVKLNNVEAARKLLDNMYSQMQADKLADILENHGPAVPEKVNGLGSCLPSRSQLPKVSYRWTAAHHLIGHLRHSQ